MIKASLTRISGSGFRFARRRCHATVISCGDLMFAQRHEKRCSFISSKASRSERCSMRNANRFCDLNVQYSFSKILILRRMAHNRRLHEKAYTDMAFSLVQLPRKSNNISHGERRKYKKSQELVNWLITRPILLLDEMILFNFVTLIAGVGVSNSGIQSRLSSRLSDYRR